MLSEANILICYMHASELRMQSYGMMKIAKKIMREEEKVNPRDFWIQICTWFEADRSLSPETRKERAGATPGRSQAADPAGVEGRRGRRRRGRRTGKALRGDADRS